jgi:O-antigen/teichoic acid export membrane protein
LQRFDLANSLGIVGMTLFTVATILVVLQGWGLLGMMAVSLPVTIVLQIPSIWLVRRVVPELHWGWGGASVRLLRTVTSFSWALFVINLSGLIQTKTDEIVIGVMLPIANITPYSIARRLSELPQILTDQFMKVLLPLASQLYAQNDESRLRALYLTSTRLTLAIFVPFACGIIILAPPFLTIWVGAVYADYAYLVIILTIASLINTSQWPAGSILQGMARHRRLSIWSLGSGMANLGLSLFLVQSIGLAGVALGTLIPTAVECIGFVLPYALSTNGVGPRTALEEMFLPTLIPAIPMAIVLYLLQQALPANSFVSIGIIGGIGVLVYGTTYLRMGATRNERQILRTLTQDSVRFLRTGFRLA